MEEIKEEEPESETKEGLAKLMRGLSLMSPAFTGYHFSRDRELIVAKAKALGLTPIIEELEELQLRSTAK